MILEWYQDNHFKPEFALILKEGNSNEYISYDYLDNLESLVSSSNEPKTDKKILRIFEKNFFLEIVEIFLYLLFFFLIFTLNYENTYIDLKVHPNEDLKQLIFESTSWNEVF